MNQKLDLLASKGVDYSSNIFSLKFSIKNYDSNSIALNKLKVIAYGLIPYKTLSNINTYVKNIGTIDQFVNINSSTPQSGIIDINSEQNVYTIFHNAIDYTKITPIVNLISPDGSSNLGPISLANRTTNSFEIVLDSPPPTNFYKISWSIPSGYSVVGGYQIIPDQPSITLTKIDPIIVNGKLIDTKIEIGWSTTNTIIPNNYSLNGVEVSIEDTQSLCNFSNWYTQLSDDLSDCSSLVLQVYEGVTWKTISEYKDFYTLDGSTSLVPTEVNNVEWGLSSYKSVYISKNSPNPLTNNSSDKNELQLWSNGTGDIRRSLLKFDSLDLPTNISKSSKSILRLSTSSLSGLSNDVSIGAYRLKKDWVETETSFSKATNSVSWSVSGGDFSSAPSYWYSKDLVDSTNVTYIDLDITQFVNYWITNPTQNFGLLLKLPNDETTTPIKISIDSFRLTNIPTVYIDYETSTNALPKITNMTQNSYIFGDVFTLSASSSIVSGSVDSVEIFYKVDDEFVFFGGMAKTTNWSATFNKTLVGDYTFQFVGKSNNGELGYSEPFDLTFISKTYFTQLSEVTYYEGSTTSISAAIQQTPRYKNQSISIYDGTTTYPTQIVSNGIVQISVPSIPTDAITKSLSATIYNYDNSAISLFTFDHTFYRQIVVVDQSYQPYPTTILPNNTSGDAFYIPSYFEIRANVVTPNGPNAKVNYYYALKNDDDYRIQSLLGSSHTSPYSAFVSLPPSTQTSGVSEYRYVMVEVNGKNCGYIKYYVKNDKSPSITLTTSTCENPIGLSGTLNDLDKTNTLIKYTIQKSILHNGTIISGSSSNVHVAGDSWTYNYFNPLTSDTNLGIEIVDNYGVISHNTLALPGQVQIDPGSNFETLLQIVDYELIADSLPILTSNQNYVLSATTKLEHITQSYFSIEESGISIDVPMNINNSTTITLGPGKIYSFTATFISNGNYTAITSPLSVIYEPGFTITTNLPSCESCYCSNKAISIYGTLVSTQNKEVYDSQNILYTTTTNIYDSNNTLIGNILYDGDYTTTWLIPSSNVTYIRYENILSFPGYIGSITNSITKQIPKAISKAPSLTILSPKWE